MLTDAYEELTDQVQEALMAGEIDDLSAWAAWLIVALSCDRQESANSCHS